MRIRTYVITGTGSGIGLATADLLTERGHRVIRADLNGSEINADLASQAGRRLLVDTVSELCQGKLDAVIACAGVLTPAASAVAVNYFGALATLEGLRPLLLQSQAPRAVAVSSMGSVSAQLNPKADLRLLALLDAGDEQGAIAHAHAAATAGASEAELYGIGKLALNRWLRRTAPSEMWAGAKIPLNAVAPGVVHTPLMAGAFATEEGVAALHRGSPAPLNGFLDPIVIARALAWLASEDNTHMCGQVMFVDGGAESIRRPTLW